MPQNRHSPQPLPSLQDIGRVIDWAIRTRRSVRAFSDRPVPRQEVEAILELARFSASGMNIQPWQVHVVSGQARRELSAAIAGIDADPVAREALEEPYPYYPREWVSPYVDRRRKVGWGLYGLLGIGKGDKERMQLQHGRNYAFFDAPVGLFLTLDRGMEMGSLIDCGMFLQSIMIAARGRGLHTCVQAAFLKYHRVIAAQLEIPDDQMLVCGMSLGHAEESSIENSLATEREPVEAFTRFHHHKKETTA